MKSYTVTFNDPADGAKRAAMYLDEHIKAVQAAFYHHQDLAQAAADLTSRVNALAQLYHTTPDLIWAANIMLVRVPW